MQEVVTDYKAIVKNLNEMIKKSGYKSSFIANTLNLSPSAFYMKRRTNSFTIDEVDKIIELLSVFEDQKLVAQLTDMLENESVNYNEKDLFNLVGLNEKL
jgi:predicted transcriptional regulator